MTKDEHLLYAKHLSAEWYRKNHRTKAERKAIQWIEIMKERRGIK